MSLTTQLELPADLEVLTVVRRGYAGRPEFDRPWLEHLLLERLLDLDLVLVGEGHDPAGSLNHLEGAGVGTQHEAALDGVLGDHQGPLPGADLDHEVVPRLRSGTAALRLDPEGGIVRSQLVRPWHDRHG